jgi:hypothetical protein
MRNDIKITFDNRPKPVFLPVSETTAEFVRSVFADAKNGLAQIEFDTVFGQMVFLRLKHVVRVNFLMDRTVDLEWSEDDLAPSRQYAAKGDVEPDYADILWKIVVYVDGLPTPEIFWGADGGDWIEFTTVIENEDPYVVVVDDDGEYIALPTAKIDLLIGTEIGRYSAAQLEIMDKMTPPELMEED